jgi:hypothetical protein
VKNLVSSYVSGIGSTARRSVVALLSVIAAAIVIALSLGGNSRDLTALSVAVAVMFGAVTSVQNAHMHRRTNTIQLLSAFSTTDALSASDARMARLIASRQTVDGDVDEETDCHIINLLDYYEFICCAAERRHIDPATVILLRGSSMRSAYLVCVPYLAARRERFGTKLYMGYDRFSRHMVSCPSAPV